MEGLTPELILKLKSLILHLESGDDKRGQDAAYLVAGILISIETKLGKLDGELREMEELALDLEVPVNIVEDYTLKLDRLVSWIKAL